MSDEIPLPPLHDAELDREQVLALTRDVTALADLLGHAVKGGATTRASEAAGTLTDETARLVAGEITGLQLRYRHDGKEWWDTLMALGGGKFRLVRIEQRFGDR